MSRNDVSVEFTPSTRVVACTGGEGTRIEMRPRPVPRGGEMLLALRASGLCGTDLFKLANQKARAGAVLGHEVVGTVEQVGGEVAGFKVGDRVVVPHHVACGKCALCVRGSETLCASFRENLLEPGGFSEHVLVRERAVKLAARKVPEEISDEAAVFLEPAACVLRGIRRAGLPELKPGSGQAICAVVLGAGSMGLLHVLVLRALHPEMRILVSDRIEERLLLAKKRGADATAPPGEDGMVELVRQETGGLGADALFDTVGGSVVLLSALELSREGGTVVLFAHSREGEQAGFELNQLFKFERNVVGTYSGALSEQEEVHSLITSRRLDASPLVTHRLPLSQFHRAVELSRSHAALKVLLLPEGNSP